MALEGLCEVLETARPSGLIHTCKHTPSVTQANKYKVVQRNNTQQCGHRTQVTQLVGFRNYVRKHCDNSYKSDENTPHCGIRQHRTCCYVKLLLFTSLLLAVKSGWEPLVELGTWYMCGNLSHMCRTLSHMCGNLSFTWANLRTSFLLTNIYS